MIYWMELGIKEIYFKEELVDEIVMNTTPQET